MRSQTSLVLIVFLKLYFFASAAVAQRPWDDFDPDIKRNVTQLISSKGYPVEDHVVQTKDGFLLSMQHMPSTKKTGAKKEVVFLQHGLLSASSDYVINMANQSLGFILADAGYDVWLGNIRGNTYSRRHIKYKPSMNQFWNYSFDQMAEYDLPAMIDYVLNITQQKQLVYVGHSQGTTAAFALLSTSPEFNKKIKLFIALAPVTTVGYITSPIKYIAPLTDDLEFLFNLLGVREFLPSNALMKFLSEYVCDTSIRYLCENVLFMLYGADADQLNQTRLGVYTAHTPAGSSTKSIVHFGQMVNSKKFCKYDYGKEGNLREYNQPTPPEYNVSKITAPVALLWALNDDLGDPTDVGLLHQKLKSLATSYLVKLPTFNHGDFVYALQANTLVYKEVLSLLNKYKAI